MRTSPTRWRSQSPRATWRRPFRRPRRQHRRPRWTMTSGRAPGAPSSDLGHITVLRHGVTGAMSRGLRPPTDPRPSGWGSGRSLRARSTRSAQFPGPSWGRRAGPACTFESYGIRHRLATALRRRLTQGSCFGTSTRHFRSTQRSCYDKASRWRSTRRMGALDFLTLGICTRAFVLNAQSTRAFMLNAHRVSSSATAQPFDVLRKIHGFRVLWLSLSYTPSLRLRRCPHAKQKVCVCICVCMCASKSGQFNSC